MSTGLVAVGTGCAIGGLLTGGFVWLACGAAATASGLAATGVATVACRSAKGQGLACEQAVIRNEHPWVEIECEVTECRAYGTIFREDKQANYVSLIFSDWYYEGSATTRREDLYTADHSGSYRYVYSEGTWYYLAEITGVVLNTPVQRCGYHTLSVEMELTYYNGLEGAGSGSGPYEEEEAGCMILS